jgi:uncharacterized caspase-like protein
LRVRYFIWLFVLTIAVASLLTVPSRSESARQQSKRQPVPARKQKPHVPNEQSRPQERGIVNIDVPDFKAETPATALVIGISSYPNLSPKAQLRYAHSDAEAIRDFLVSEKGGFRSEDVTLLINEEATREQILRQIGVLQESTGQGGLVLIFFAGHGFVNKSKQAFLIASDTRAEDLHASGVDMTSLNSTVQNMRARSVVIITDACHAGALGDSFKAGQLENVSARDFDSPAQRFDQSSFIFSAASPTQSSIEDPDLKGGLFTHFTLQGLKGAADDKCDGIVTTQEL